MRKVVTALMLLLPIELQAAESFQTTERQLRYTLDVDAQQQWRNDKQWSKSTSRQRYEIATRLRSDGRLYSDNLLDPDTEQRTRIKSEYYIYQGLLKLKSEYGGRLPSLAELGTRAPTKPPQADGSCMEAMSCGAETAERYAALTAMQHNTAEELEAFIASYDEPGGRYRYFRGYPGCPNTLKLTHAAHFEGEQAFDREKKKLQPFTLDWKADSRGNAVEQRALCEHYVVVVDEQTKAVYVENLFIPSARGSSVLTVSGKSESREADLPVPSEVLAWTQEQVSLSRDRVSKQASLRITRPLDGNATVLGAFDGIAKVKLDWAFEPAN